MVSNTELKQLEFAANGGIKTVVLKFWGRQSVGTLASQSIPGKRKWLALCPKDKPFVWKFYVDTIEFVRRESDKIVIIVSSIPVPIWDFAWHSETEHDDETQYQISFAGYE